MSKKTSIYKGYSAAVERRFDVEPSPGRERSKFSYLDKNLTCCNAGQLIPFLHFPLLPGDNLYFSPKHLFRLSNALVAPMMDDIIVYYYLFKTYNRFVYEDWNAFMGENIPQDPDYDEGSVNNGGDTLTQPPYNEPGLYELPTLKIVGSGDLPAFDLNSLYDQFCLPYNVKNNGYEIQTLKLRHYNLIYNLFFRDQNLQDFAPVPKSSGPDKLGQYKVLPVVKYRDYFTGALPFLQKGPSVNIGLVGDIPVEYLSDEVVPNASRPVFYVANSDGTYTADGLSSGSKLLGYSGGTGGSGLVQAGTSTSNNGARYVSPVARLDEAQAISLALVRLGFQMQRFYEGQARSGTRYIEYVRFMFDVYIPDAQLQQPEFIGGGKFYINVNPVVQTSESTNQSSPLGTLAAFGVAYHRDPNTIHCVANEHGYVLGLFCIRTGLSYQQGLQRDWSYRDRFDFYTPTLAHLAEQEVKNKEILCTGIPEYDEGTFGYIGRYDEYRTTFSRICSYFRSGIPGSLDAYHLGQYFPTDNLGDATNNFAGAVHLNANFIRQPSDVIDRALNLPSNPVAKIPQFLCQSVTAITGTRCISKYGIPGYADHF